MYFYKVISPVLPFAAHFVGKLVSRLDGRDISSLNIVTTREEFAERLAGMKE